jgi:hypothetical protein
MHGGCTAIFAMVALSLMERVRGPSFLAFVPGFALAAVLHSAYNHAFGPPMVSTLAVIVVLPPLLLVVFQRSERATAEWLGSGFDVDAEMLESIMSGSFPDSPAGRYLATLKQRFQGPVVADLLCYLRLHTELALRAKGILMMRESGFEARLDEATRWKLDEMRYLEGSIGRTGRLALMPLLHGGHKDIWQLRLQPPSGRPRMPPACCVRPNRAPDPMARNPHGARPMRVRRGGARRRARVAGAR